MVRGRDDSLLLLMSLSIKSCLFGVVDIPAQHAPALDSIPSLGSLGIDYKVIGQISLSYLPLANHKSIKNVTSGKSPVDSSSLKITLDLVWFGSDSFPESNIYLP